MSSADGLAGADVHLEHLVKAYGSFAAVDNVSVTIRRGEFFTILGPSGSGKTTTMMMIAGFVYPTSGTIRIDDKDVASLPPQRRDLGMVFQNYAVFPHLSVFENIAFPLKVRKVPKAKIKTAVNDILQLVKLEDFASRMPRELSGGQQQRVALARALVFRPRVLLMDEPLGALDKKLRDHMQTEIRRIHKSLGVTVAYVTHDQGEALTMSDRIAIMNEGRIEQIGTPTELYDRPDTRFVADFLGDTNFITGTLVAVENGQGRVRTQAGWEFTGTLASQSMQTGAAVAAGVRPEKIRLCDKANGALNYCDGVVQNVVCAGDTMRYEIQAPSTTGLHVTATNRLDIPRYASAQPVTLAWDSLETRIFPA